MHPLQHPEAQMLLARMAAHPGVAEHALQLADWMEMNGMPAHAEVIRIHHMNGPGNDLKPGGDYKRGLVRLSPGVLKLTGPGSHAWFHPSSFIDLTLHHYAPDEEGYPVQHNHAFYADDTGPHIPKLMDALRDEGADISIA